MSPLLPRLPKRMPNAAAAAANAPHPDAWISLGAPPEELRLDTTLRGGQSFRWRPTGDQECEATDVLFCHRTTQSTARDRDQIRARLRDYFQLDVSLAELYRHWSLADPHFARLAGAVGLRGIRVLKQDPTETLFAFICSSNNNVGRIEKMVNTLCEKYGPFVGSYSNVAYHQFPGVSSLIGPDVERELREAGFGYRAKYIAETARKLHARHGEGPGGPEAWLAGLRQASYAEARAAVMEFSGVGPKVADCVCLMALDKTGAVPVVSEEVPSRRLLVCDP
ncbi:MAG: N-glycosylase/DNA lyase [Olpidium bornovanus]|uniref:N-glycosylase/DNA lyase n=1 Tax=Olpidium bornovanus TaxID=278681 RepID=A0A8H7ZME0_9FUNG|nr:MAG: N-glycosylase/DNA lyase [Olpidium bornovanus]